MNNKISVLVYEINSIRCNIQSKENLYKLISLVSKVNLYFLMNDLPIQLFAIDDNIFNNIRLELCVTSQSIDDLGMNSDKTDINYHRFRLSQNVGCYVDTVWHYNSTMKKFTCLKDRFDMYSKYDSYPNFTV